MLRNAVIIVGTGRYFLLALRLISQINLRYKCEKSFLAIHLFTDQNLNIKIPNVILHEISPMDWHNSTFFRFEAAEIIIGFNYDNIIYMDADTSIISSKLCHTDLYFGELFGIQHPFHLASILFVNRTASSAYIDPELRKIYYQASIYGGAKTSFTGLINDAKKRLNTDLNNGLMADYEDESYVQPYLNENNAVTIDFSNRFILGDKGLGKERDFVHGRILNMYHEWPDKEYEEMILQAIYAIENGIDWDIDNKSVIYL
jgi:hypothetical protein